MVQYPLKKLNASDFLKLIRDIKECSAGPKLPAFHFPVSKNKVGMKKNYSELGPCYLIRIMNRRQHYLLSLIIDMNHDIQDHMQ